MHVEDDVTFLKCHLFLMNGPKLSIQQKTTNDLSLYH